MKSLLPWCVLAGIVAPLWMVGIYGYPAYAAEPEQRMLSHDVFFTLKDNSTEAKKQLVAGCKKFLSEQPGTVWFAAGMLVEDHQREVNDRSFDVALHIVFKNKMSHDKYQEAPQHHQFIEEFKDNWKAVRVLDSWLDVSSHGMVSVQVSVEMEHSDEAKEE